MTMSRSTLKMSVLLACFAILELGHSPKIAAQRPDSKAPAKATERRVRPAKKKLTNQQQRDKVWNSPDMLRARAWLEDYFRASKKYTPEKAAEYRSHLKAMTAQQMELWLMQFEGERQRQHAQQLAWHKVHHEMVANQVAAIRQRQRDLAKSESRASLAAAQDEQGRIEDQQKFSENMALERQQGSGYGAYGGYGGGGYYTPAYHFHFYP